MAYGITSLLAMVAAISNLRKEDKMQLVERLKDLVGHDVTVYICLGGGINEGLLEEVGADYIVFRPWDRLDKNLKTDSYWFIKLADAMPILHAPDCHKCAAKTP